MRPETTRVKGEFIHITLWMKQEKPVDDQANAMKQLESSKMHAERVFWALAAA